MEGIMIGLWFGDHGNALRYFGQCMGGHSQSSRADNIAHDTSIVLLNGKGPVQPVLF